MRPPGAAVSKATLGKVRRMLVERLTPEALNPFARTPENEALVRSTLAAICAEPELDLAINPVLIAEIEAAICGLGPLQPLVDDPEVAVLDRIRPDLVSALRAGTELVERRLDAMPARALSLTVIHGDFTRWNVRFRGGRLTGVLDFDLTHLDTRAADLAMARAARSPELLDAYRAESARLQWPLAAEEEHVLPALDAALMIGIVAWELYGQLVAGVMDLELVERQVQKLRLATFERATRDGAGR